MKKTMSLLTILLTCSPLLAQKNVTISSPDKKIVVNVTTGNKLLYSISYQGKILLDPSPISLTLSDGKVLGQNIKLAKSPSVRSVNSQVKPLYGMAEVYPDVYNELLMDFTGGYSVVFRVYDKGVAYRLVTSFPGTIQVKNEEAVWNFPEKYQGYFHRVNGFETSFEEHYLHDAISVLDKGAIASLPLYVDAGVARMVITEADLLDYPGLYLTWNGKSGLQGVLPQVPKTVQPGGLKNFNLRVKERYDYLAETNGTRAFPWRLTVIVPED
ncbi:MAG TPA: glycoside hydrolase family 97 N-terminal domain-containing protein, partial [Bacteroidales bacterium]|nr:glycoside hydrolase family 97 N-terminal domain-containing protein [Bacteroidales bacterium]